MEGNLFTFSHLTYPRKNHIFSFIKVVTVVTYRRGSRENGIGYNRTSCVCKTLSNFDKVTRIVD